MITIFFILLFFILGVSAFITAVLHNVEPLFMIGALLIVLSVAISVAGTTETKTINIKHFRVEKTEYRVIVSVENIEKTYKDVETYNKIDKLESINLIEEYNFWGFKNKESISLNFKN